MFKTLFLNASWERSGGLVRKRHEGCEQTTAGVSGTQPVYAEMFDGRRQRRFPPPSFNRHCQSRW
ncbi:MAG TPA: hypothetical protein VM098_08255, partial [Phycisphaerae bacterium]|nr:hypothetical protein [Phycisphaerae bacterium]